MAGPYILALESALDVCSVALGNAGEIIAEKNISGTKLHANLLTVLMRDILKENGVEYDQLNAVSLSMGPGSYTGLRIGTSAAKGLCFALDIPLIAINTLQVMAYGAKHFSGDGYMENDIVFCPMIDARRMEIYYALYDSAINEIKPVEAAIVDEDFFQSLVNENAKVVFFGNALQKCLHLIPKQNNALIIDDFELNAAQQLQTAYMAYKKNAFVNLYTFEPFYLKDFAAGKPSDKINKLLNR